jgi:hypothetical protein
MSAQALAPSHNPSKSYPRTTIPELFCNFVCRLNVLVHELNGFLRRNNV